MARSSMVTSGALTVKEGPTVEPLTVDEVKEHSRIVLASPEDDSLIPRLIRVARMDCEAFQRRTYITTTYELALPSFRRIIHLPRPPLQSVERVSYRKADGSEEDLTEDTDFFVDDRSEPARIILARDYITPNIYDMHPVLPVLIEYKAGYGLANSVPDSIKQAMLLQIAHLYENREIFVEGGDGDEVYSGVKALLWKDRVMLA